MGKSENSSLRLVKRFSLTCWGNDLANSESTSIARAYLLCSGMEYILAIHTFLRYFDYVQLLFDCWEIFSLNIWNLDQIAIYTVPNFCRISCESGSK